MSDPVDTCTMKWKAWFGVVTVFINLWSPVIGEQLILRE